MLYLFVRNARVLIALGLFGVASLACAVERVPNTLAEAFDALDQELTVSERDAFKASNEIDAVTRVQRSWGRYIRNEWFRSGPSELPAMLARYGASSLDDMSSMVLSSYCRHLNGKKIDLEAMGNCFKRYWEESARLEQEARSKGENGYRVPDLRCP